MRPLRRKRDALTITYSILDALVAKGVLSRAALLRMLGLNPYTLYAYLERLYERSVVDLVETGRGVYIRPLPQAYRLHSLLRVIHETLGGSGSKAAREYNEVIEMLSEQLARRGYRVELRPSALYDMVVENGGCIVRVAVLEPGDPFASLRAESLGLPLPAGRLYVALTGARMVAAGSPEELSAVVEELCP